MKSSFAPRHGFTLIELLCVITIIGLLAGLLMPVTQSMISKARDTTCMNNLRQIGMAANSAANDNDNKYPIIEIDENGQIVGSVFETPALPMDQALAPYGITPASLQCPADLRGPNNFAIQNPHSSYMWAPYSEDTSSATPVVLRRRGQTSVNPSRLVLCTDWSAVHPGATYSSPKMIYAVYGDGHVKTTQKVKKS